jgi:lipopolysaccharide biosynthesis glycosyltransferase
MKESIHVAFAADRRVLPGLHVAAYSVVENHRDARTMVHLHIFSNDLTSTDVALLRVSLNGVGRDYELSFHSVGEENFKDFPSMGGSWSTYFRILMPVLLDTDRIVYLDVDTLCRLDVAEFLSLDLRGHPAGFVAETTIAATPDFSLRALLPQEGEKPYFNAGVMIVDRKVWIEKRVTERSFEFLSVHHPQYHDQTTLNYILFGDWRELDHRFNFISNWRQNWKYLRSEETSEGRLIHFLDHPKPWDLGAEIILPHYHLWRAVLEKTAMRHYRSWNDKTRKIPDSKSKRDGYRKTLKDKVLFALYRRGLMTPKGANH